MPLFSRVDQRQHQLKVSLRTIKNIVKNNEPQVNCDTLKTVEYLCCAVEIQTHSLRSFQILRFGWLVGVLSKLEERNLKWCSIKSLFPLRYNNYIILSKKLSKIFNYRKGFLVLQSEKY